jgi:predicted flap endonuclease-1-like 5' DNA nuclease
MEISFWLVLLALGALFAFALACFLLGWFFGNGIWDERCSGFQSQIRELRERLTHTQQELEEERAISGNALQASHPGQEEGFQEKWRACETRRTALEAELATWKTRDTAPAPASAATPSPEPPAPPPPQPAAKQSEPAAKDDKSAVLARIRERASLVNFDRIGRASEGEKDDLQRIKGIGPFIEEKLNSIGIRTFRQIASFVPEDEDQVNEAIEFFPGRIRRDEWSRQAREFLG